MKTKITKTTIEGLATRALPTNAKGEPIGEEKIRDVKTPGFVVRFYRTRRAVYAVELARNVAPTLGDVRKFEDPETARTLAKKLLAHYALTGEVLGFERPDAAPAVDPRTLVEVFGLRAKYAADGVEVAGLYRDRKRNGRRLMTGHLEAMLDRFVLFVGPTTPFASITSDHVAKWVEAEARRVDPRTSERAKDASVVRYLADLRTAFTWATKKKIDGVALIATNPAKGVGVEKTETVDRSKTPRFLNDEEEARLDAALAARDVALRASGFFGPTLRRDGCVYADYLTPLVTLAKETGGRRGALFNLRWHHLENLPVHRVKFEGCYQKAGQTYYVPLSKKARAVLAAWKPADAAPSDLVFPSTTGGVKSSTPDSWYRILDAAEIADFRWHDLRHTFASKLVQRGVALFQVSKWMGHASIRMTERYAHLDPRQNADALELLAVKLIPPTAAATTPEAPALV